MRLLIAEPTKSVSELIRCVCHSENFECEVANNVTELFRLLKERSFDIICLAPNIGSENGIDVLKQIRKLPAFKFIPIFLFTASPDSKRIYNAIKAGATDLIAKSDFESLRYFLHRFKEGAEPLNAKILVVEDSPLQQQIFLALLTKLGCHVDFSDNANDAFDIYQRNTYDLVITDIVLKGAFSGIALAGRIRRLKTVAGDVPILAVTGYDDPSREASLFSYGVSDYLKKPVEEVRFCRQVRHLITSYQNYKNLEKKTAELIKSDKSRIQFWANLSHEIRTPLNGIIGSLQLINNDDITDSKRTYFDAVKSSSEMLLSLVNDVLELTKAESGKIHFSPKVIDLNKNLKQQLNIVKSLADKKQLKLNYTFATEIPRFIECDVKRLNQVVSNLLNNAVKFTDKGSVSFHCEVIDNVVKNESLRQLKFSVVDTGIGIAENEHFAVFDKFKQANEDVEAIYGGTGVGLHIAKLIVSMWGGNIGVDSQLGKGSCFWFTMPLKVADKPVATKQAHLEFANPQDKTVLVVDDAEINILVAKGLLMTLGLEVDVAIDGEEALEKMRKHSYDCVLMDCNMPNMSGLEATRIFRESEGESKKLPIIALTAHSSDDYKKECEQAGMDGFLEKPFGASSLIEILNTHIK